MIRERQRDDMPALAGLVRRVHEIDGYPIHLPDGDVERFLARPTSVAAWVAIDSVAIVGHVALNAETSRPVMELAASLEDERPAIYVSRLFVDPDERRTGSGRQLLEHARREAISMGRLPVLDVVDIPTAAPAISLYRSSGWEEIGSVRFDLVGNEVTERVFVGPDRPEPTSGTQP